MDLKECRMRKKDKIQKNTRIIYKNGAKEMRIAKERLSTK